MDNVVIIKLISNLLYPMGLVFAFLALGFVGRLLFCRDKVRNLTSICYFLSFLCLTVFSNPMVASWLVESLERQYPQRSLKDIVKHDVIIVLGGGLRIPLPPTQHIQLSAGSDRYWYAARLYKSAKADQIILTGGNVYQQPGYHGEVYYAAQLLQEWGVPAEDIVIEDQSRTTEQNMKFTSDLIEKTDIDSALLVTSAIHMPRSYSLFSNLPISITPASADVIIRQSNAPKVFSWFPSVNAMMLSTAALHEYYGKWFADLKAVISKSS